MMYSKIILLKCVLIVICAAQEHKLEQNNGKDTGSYTYNIEFTNDNKGEYGHKIEVKNGNLKDNSNNLKVKNSGVAPKPFTHERKVAPLSKPSETNFAHVSKHQNSPQQYIEPYQPSRRPATPNQVTLDKNQLAILLAQNKNPYLLSEKDRNIISQQAAHVQSFPYQVSDIQLTSQYVPPTPSQHGLGNAQSNHLSPPQQVVASKPEFKHVYAPQVSTPTHQQYDLYSKKYSKATSQIQKQHEGQQIAHPLPTNNGGSQPLVSSPIQQHSGLYPKEYSDVFSQTQNQQELPQFAYSSSTNDGAGQQKLFVPTATQQQSGLYTKEYSQQPQKFAYIIPSSNGATHHNLPQSSQTQHQTDLYTKEYSGIQSQIQNQQPQKFVYVIPSNDGATQFKQQQPDIYSKEYPITTQFQNQNGAHQFVYSTPTSTTQNNVQFSYPNTQQSSLYSKEYSGLTSQIENQQNTHKFAYLLPSSNTIPQHSSQGSLQTQQQFDLYSKQQGVQDFAYSNNAATQQIPVSSTPQQADYHPKQFSYVFPQVQTQEPQQFEHLYPSNGKTTQHIPVSSSSQQTQYQQVQNTAVQHSSNGGGSQHSNFYQFQYNPSGQYPQHPQSSATYQIPQHATQTSSQGQHFVFTPQNQPMQAYVLVAPTSQAALTQSTSFPQHSLTQQSYSQQLSQQPQTIVSHPSTQTPYIHIPQGSNYNIQQNQQIPNNNYYNGNPGNIGYSPNIEDLKIQSFNEALASYGKKYGSKQIKSSKTKPVSNVDTNQYESLINNVQPSNLNQGNVAAHYSFASANNNKDINSAYSPKQNYVNVNNIQKDGAPNKAYDFKSQNTYNVHEPTSDANIKYVYYVPSNAPTAVGSKKA